MKSLKLKRLMSLENNAPVTIVYGNYRRFSGIVTENDNKKSLEIKNKKDEFLIVDYSDIVSLKIKKKSSSAIIEKKSVCSDEPEISVKQICPDEQQIPENYNYHDEPQESEKIQDYTQAQETAPDEEVYDFGFLSEDNYISVVQITEADIRDIYDSIPKELKNDINKYYNSFTNGVRVHENERCSQAASNLVDYIYQNYDYEYGIDETDERIHRLCAYMMAYSGDYEGAVSEFSAVSDWYSAALYAYYDRKYRQAAGYASDYLEEYTGNDEQSIKNMIYILVYSCLECDDFSAYASAAENRPEIFVLSDDSEVMKKCMDYMIFRKGISEEKIASENKIIENKSAPPENDNINYGYIMTVNAGSFSGIIHSYSKKVYNFENKEIIQQELKNKLKDSTLLPVEVIFESYDNKNAVSIKESDLNSSEMLERGKKYFARKKYSLAIQCYHAVFVSPVLSEYSSDAEKEKAVLEVTHCYMSLANISDERMNINNALTNLNKYSRYVHDMPKLCISFIDAYEKLRKTDKVLDYIEKLISSENARPSEKLHHISKKIKIFLEKNDFEKAYDACMQWIEVKEKSSAEMEYADNARYREIQSSKIEPFIRICLDEIKKSEEAQAVQPENTEPAPVLQPVYESEIIPEKQQTVPEKPACKPEKQTQKTETVIAEPEKNLFICPDPEKLGIQPEYTDTKFSEESISKNKSLSPKSFISDLKKKCGKSVNSEAGFIKIMHMISVMDIVDKAMLEMQFISSSSLKKSPAITSNFFKTVIGFMLEYGILNRISCESLSGQKLYSASSSGRNLLSKNTVAKFLQINYKNVHNTGTINSQTVMSFGKCFEAISSFIKMCSDSFERFVKFDSSLYESGTERIFCINFNDSSFEGDRRIFIAAPVISEEFSYNYFSECENMLRNRLERKLDGNKKAVLLIISDIYGSQWAECYAKIFTDIIEKENIFIQDSEDNYSDMSGNQVTEEYILRKALPELPEKSDDSDESENAENPDTETDEPENTENSDTETAELVNAENPDTETAESENTENSDTETAELVNAENPDTETAEPENTENPDTETEEADESQSDDEEFIETESYKSYMYDWKMTGLDFSGVVENTKSMIAAGKFYCAVTYLKAASEINSEFAPLYNAFSWAADSPSENHCYISGEIFSAFENQSGNESEFFGYCMLASVIRAVFYNDSEYDYSINQLYESVSGNPLIEKIPEINSFMEIICGFRNEFHRGMDFYADYRMKGRISAEAQIKEAAENADELYNKYVDSVEITENFRIKILRKIMFENSGQIAHLLDIVRNNKKESASEAEQFLTDKIIRRNSSVTVSAIDDRRIEEYVDEMWAEAGRLMKTEYHRHTIASSDFMGSKRRNITVAISKIAKVLCEWLSLVRMSADDNDSARIGYSRQHDELINLCSTVIDKTDEHESGRGIELINNVMRDIRSRLNGSYDKKSRRYYFIDFLRNDFVTLDENGIPDTSSSFCLLPEFNIMERIYRHFTSEQKNFDERLSEIFSRETKYNDYGSAKFIDEYLEYIGSSCQNRSFIDDIGQYCIYSENMADINRENFIGDLELAQSYGQIYSPENKKDTMLLMSEIWYRKSCETKNFGFFTKLIGNFRKLIRDDADKHSERLRNQLDDIRKIDGVSDDDINKIEALISKQNFTVAEDHMNRIHNGEKLSDDSLNLEGIEYLREFWHEYRVNYDICANSGKSLKSLVAKQPVHNKDSKARQELIDNWLSNGGSTNETQIKNLVEKLGWKNCTVKRESSQIYKVYPEKPQNGRKINYKHPIAAFGSSAQQNGFRVVCIAGIYDCRRLIDKFHEIGCSNHTLVFLDCAVTDPERRALAKEIKKDIALSKTFAVVDRVVLMYLANHYSENNISRMLMAVTMPFSYYQPYVIDSSKVMPAEIFMGREYELNKIESPEGVNIIYGGRQLGKSALLKMARNDVDHDENGDRAVYVDIHKLGIEAAAGKISGELMINGILDKVYDNWNDLAFALKARLAKNPSDEDYIPYLLLMLDEADTFIKDCGNHEYEPLALLKDIQSIGTDRFKFVVAGLRDIVRFDREIALGNNSVITHLRAITIKSFEYKEARELLTLPLSYMGICFPDSEMISLILATTNYFPGLIQLYCAKLLETLRGKDYAYYIENECPPYIVTEKHIKKVLTDKEFNSQIKEKFEITLRSDECPGEEENGYHYYLIALLISYLCYDSSECSDSGYTAEDIGRVADAFEINKISMLGTDKLVTILDELCSLNILRRTDAGKYHFKRDSFLAMMGKNSSDIENKLMEYIGK